MMPIPNSAYLDSIGYSRTNFTLLAQNVTLLLSTYVAFLTESYMDLTSYANLTTTCNNWPNLGVVSNGSYQALLAPYNATHGIPIATLPYGFAHGDVTEESLEGPFVSANIPTSDAMNCSDPVQAIITRLKTKPDRTRLAYNRPNNLDNTSDTRWLPMDYIRYQDRYKLLILDSTSLSDFEDSMGLPNPDYSTLNNSDLIRTALARLYGTYNSPSTQASLDTVCYTKNYMTKENKLPRKLALHNQTHVGYLGAINDNEFGTVYLSEIGNKFISQSMKFVDGDLDSYTEQAPEHAYDLTDGCANSKQTIVDYLKEDPDFSRMAYSTDLALAFDDFPFFMVSFDAIRQGYIMEKQLFGGSVEHHGD